MKPTAAMVLITLAPAVALALPEVTLDGFCPFHQAMNSQAETLSQQLSYFLGEEIEWADLDIQGGAGDGVPDSWQLALLGAALCSGDEDLVRQFEINRQLYLTLCDHLSTLVRFVAGVPFRGPPRLDQRLAALVNIIDAHPELLADPAGVALRELMNGLAAELETVFSGQESFLVLLPSVIPMWREFADWISALAGLSSESSDAVLALLDQLTAEIENTIAQAEGAVPVLNSVANSEFLTTAERSQFLAVATELQNAVDALTWIVTVLPESIEVYGSYAKTADEPFSGEGDYDQDGNSNAAAYAAITAVGGTQNDFVAAASGAFSYWPGNQNMSAAGLTALAALSIFIAASAALTLRKIEK